MRVLALGAVLVLLVALALVWVLLRERSARRQAAAQARARWSDAHYVVPGGTRVVVRRTAQLSGGEQQVLDESVVDEVPDGDPDWHARFTRARQTAYDRAIDLNGGPLLG